MKKKFKSLIVFFSPLLVKLLSVFFDKKYLQGRHFYNTYIGVLWCARAIWQRNILRLAPPLPFPAALNVRISAVKNIDFHPDDLNNFQSTGIYFQNFDGKIKFGRGVYIAPNVGLITSNHDPVNPHNHLSSKDIVLGEGCWVGMNSVILPGVRLGPRTVVGAGAVVTKSFPEGFVVIAGNPAKKLKDIARNGDFLQ